ncbi:hypothetical protein BKA62DRAFT_227709 [Auriculariales sp. MPI-PUGE-AT-0066]|nr:hypothetical protein BKA62DRAFT_227709 [Auriculariales sp. MPI-PUGE-AT-0066]
MDPNAPPAIAPAVTIKAQSSSSTSTTLWAIASKEWVIPPRPKPGRKPKKPQASAEGVEKPPVRVRRFSRFAAEGDHLTRRLQERAPKASSSTTSALATQRVTRKVKDSSATPVQPVSMAVCPQTGAKRDESNTKEVSRTLVKENTTLKDENTRLKAELARLMAESQVGTRDVMLKRSHDAIASVSNDRPAHKRRRSDLPPAITKARETVCPSAMLMLDERTAGSSRSQMDLPPEYVLTSAPEDDSINSYYRGSDRHSLDKLLLPPMRMNCVICADEPLKCICGDMSAEPPPAPDTEMDSGDSLDTKLSGVDSFGESLPPFSVLENLPPYQPPVPLRRRTTSSRGTRVFAYTTPDEPPMCTGDPSSCPACADDPFGKAFCEALGGMPCDKPGCKCASSAHPAARSSSPPIVLPPLRCPHGANCNCGTMSATIAALSGGHPPIQQPQPSKTIPTNCAWSQLKSHPNVAFTDLRLLAEVVAGKDKCTGPRVLLSPRPEIQDTRGGAVSNNDEASCSKQPYLEVKSSNLLQALELLDRQGAEDME